MPRWDRCTATGTGARQDPFLPLGRMATMSTPDGIWRVEVIRTRNGEAGRA